jgi:hypothetical protein
MAIAKLDYFFPFCVFFYGIFWIFVTESGLLTRGLKKASGDAKSNAASTVLVHLHSQLMAHEALAWICFWGGGLWSLQNLVF